MTLKNYLTSSDLIDRIKKTASIPISQNTYEEQDILNFANSEMELAQIPSIMSYHQEYFTTYKDIPLVSNVSRYKIPERAMGLKCRDVVFVANDETIYEMTQLDASYKAMFNSSVANGVAYAFYFEGNDIVLTPKVGANPSGALRVFYFQKPNRLVSESRAANITKLIKQISVDSDYVSVGDNLTFAGNVFTCVAEGAVVSGNTFNYSPNSAQLALNLRDKLDNIVPSIEVDSGSNILEMSLDSASYNIQTSTQKVTIKFTGKECVGDWINFSGTQYTAGTDFALGTPSVSAANFAALLVGYTVVQADSTLIISKAGEFNIKAVVNSKFSGAMVVSYPAFVVSPYVGLQVESVPANITTGSYVDLIEKANGFKNKAIDVVVRDIADNIILVDNFPYDISIGDYVCSQGECVIPPIPADLHNGFVDRVVARILSIIGGEADVAISNARLGNVDKYQSVVASDRADGAPKKIVNRFSLLNTGRIGSRNKF